MGRGRGETCGIYPRVFRDGFGSGKGWRARRLRGVGVDYWDGSGGTFWWHDRVRSGERERVNDSFNGQVLAGRVSGGGWLSRADERWVVGQRG